MANPSVTNEELQFKQRARRRLIGAVTLVTALVVFLPMVLDNEPKPVAEDIAINIPSQDANSAKGAAGLPQKIGVPEIAAPEIVTPKSAVAKNDLAPPVPPAKTESPTIKPIAPPIQPLTVLPGGQMPKTPASQPEPPKPEKTSAPADEVVKEVAKPVAAVAPQHQEPPPAKSTKPAEPAAPAAPKETKPAAKSTEAPAPAQGGFVVRLGAFSKPENARQLKAKVAAMGIRHYTGVLKTASGDKTLVRAGPYATRKEAEMARDRLKAADVVGDVVAK